MIGKTPEKLFDLPPIQDPSAQPAMRLLLSYVTAAFFVNRSLVMFGMTEAIKLTFKKGTHAVSILSYLGYAYIQASIFSDFKTSNQFGQLALRLTEKFQPKVEKPIILLTYEAFITFWQENMQQAVNRYPIIFQDALDVGDLVVAGTAAFVYVCWLYLSGKNLSYISKEAEKYSHFLLKIGEKNACQNIRMTWQSVLRLSGHSEESIATLGANIDIKTTITSLLEKQNLTGAYLAYLNEISFQYLTGEYKKAYECINETTKIMPQLKGQSTSVVFFQYACLVYMKHYPEMTRKEKRFHSKISKNLC